MMNLINVAVNDTIWVDVLEKKKEILPFATLYFTYNLARTNI